MQQPNVRPVLFAYLITYFGTAMAPIAIAFGVLEATGSAKDMSIVMAGATVATILVLMVSGAIADRTSRQMVIVFSELSAMLFQLCIAVLFLADQATVPLLTVLMFLNGMAVGFNAPAETGFIPQLVKAKDLQSMNSVLGIARNASLIAGAAFGGILVALIGAGWTVAIDAATFAISAVIMWRLKPAKQEKTEGESLWLQLKQGWDAFTSHTWLWVVVVQFAFVLAAFQAVVNVIGPAISNDFFAGAKSWGYIMAAMSTGLFVGGLIGLQLKPKHPIRVASFCVFSAALMPLALSSPAPVVFVMLAAFVNGICWELFGILWISTLQRKIAPDMLSRVSAYDYIGSIALAPVGIVVAGILYESLGYRLVSLAAAGLIIVATLAVLFVRDVWNLQD